MKKKQNTHTHAQTYAYFRLDSHSQIPSLMDDCHVSSSASPSTCMDWMPIASPPIINDFCDDNNPDFTQFLNLYGNDHHLLFDNQSNTCQQQNPLTFDLLSPSSPMI